MRVHPSNFHMKGFTAKPELGELAELGRARGIPLYEDLGSGCVVDLRRFGITEPLVSDSVQAGVNLVSFSGDKLLGGPQAGILAGDAGLVERLRRNPMFRALRLDKLIYQSAGDNPAGAGLRTVGSDSGSPHDRPDRRPDPRARRTAARASPESPGRGSTRTVRDRRRFHAGSIPRYLAAGRSVHRCGQRGEALPRIGPAQ